MLSSLVSGLLSAMVGLSGGAFDAPFESKIGELWFYHPYDGTFKYNACEVNGEWKLSSDSMTLDHLGVLCEGARQWTFDQKMENLIFDRRLEEGEDALFLDNKRIGQVLSQNRGFVVDFVDQWDDRHHVKVLDYLREDESRYQRLDWFVQSDQYISFDLQVWGE